MQVSEARLHVLENLVNELLKDNPKEELVERHMKDAKIKDPKDPVARIHSVLEALSFEMGGGDFRE